MDNKQMDSEHNSKKTENGLFGIEVESSLESVKFATTKNRYLEQIQEETDEE